MTTHLTDGTVECAGRNRHRRDGAHMLAELLVVEVLGIEGILVDGGLYPQRQPVLLVRHVSLKIYSALITLRNNYVGNTGKRGSPTIILNNVIVIFKVKIIYQ